MGLRTWIARLRRAVDTEYDRRIKRASNVVAYGAHGHEHDQHVDQEDDGAVIVNLAPGMPVRSTTHHEAHHHAQIETSAPRHEQPLLPTTPAISAHDHEDEVEEAEIINIPLGAPARAANDT